MPRQSNKTVTK